MEEEWFFFRRLRPLLIIDHAHNLSDSSDRLWRTTVLLCRLVDKSLSSPYLVAGRVGTERINLAIRQSADKPHHTRPDRAGPDAYTMIGARTCLRIFQPVIFSRKTYTTTIFAIVPDETNNL